MTTSVLRRLSGLTMLVLGGACAGGSTTPARVDTVPVARPAASPSGAVAVLAPASASATPGAEAAPAPPPIEDHIWSADGRFLSVRAGDRVAVFEAPTFAPVARFGPGVEHLGRAGSWLVMTGPERLVFVREGQSAATVLPQTRGWNRLAQPVAKLGVVRLGEPCDTGMSAPALCLMQPPATTWKPLVKGPVCPAGYPVLEEGTLGSSTDSRLVISVECMRPDAPARSGAQGNWEGRTSSTLLVTPSPLRVVPLGPGWIGFFMPGGRRLLKISNSGQTTGPDLLDAATGRLVSSLPIVPPGAAGTLLLGLDFTESLVAVAHPAGIHLFDARSGAPRGVIPAAPDDVLFEESNQVSIQEQTVRVMPSFRGSSLKRWSLPALQPGPALDLPASGDLGHEFSPTGRHVVSVPRGDDSPTSKVIVTSLDTGTRRTLDARGEASFDPQDRWLLVGDTVWSVATGERVARLAPLYHHALAAPRRFRMAVAG